MSDESKSSERSRMNWKKTLAISLFILLAAVAVIWLIFSTEPVAQRGGATKQTAMLVEVTPVEKGAFRPEVVVTGTVQAEQDIMLSPRVGGEIVRRSPNFVPGGFVRKGEVLLQIDPADYKNALLLRKSELRQAEADLALEMGRQKVARQDFRLLDDTVALENESLVLREPQLNSVQARIQAAEAAVQQAELNLQRTTIKAPFDALILSRDVNLGSQVAPGEVLGQLVGVERYWVELSVPLSKLRWLDFPEDERTKGSKVKIRSRAAWEPGMYRTGFIHRLVGALEDQTRLARVLVTVPDPLGRQQNADSIPPLVIGAFVEATIEAEEIEEVVRLNRDYIRKDQTVWVKKEGQLDIREVNIVFQDANYAYISEGLEGGDLVVMTNLSTVVEGAPLRLEGEDQTSDTLSSGKAKGQSGNNTTGGTQ